MSTDRPTRDSMSIEEATVSNMWEIAAIVELLEQKGLKVAANALATYYEEEKVTLSVTLAELSRLRSGSLNREPVETSASFMEPAIRIERTTCGLRISDSPTSDNLTPQETTNQDAPDMGPDGAGLSCPGSSVVAEERIDGC
jgi:hypothetical protein